MKKRFLLFLCFLACMLLLAACGKSSGKTDGAPAEGTQAQSGNESGSEIESGGASLQDMNEIPSDGIITKQQFASVAGEDRDIRFSGQTDQGITYTWTYHAGQIQNPEDQNLRIDFDLSDFPDVKKQANNANDALKMTMHGKGVICSPELEVTIPQAWRSDSGLLLKEQNGNLAKMSDVTIKSEFQEDDTAESKSAAESKLTEPSKGTTTFTMSILSLDGDSYIVGGITDAARVAAINQQAQANANAGGSGDEKAKTAASAAGTVASGSSSGSPSANDADSESGGSSSGGSSSKSSSGSKSSKSKKSGSDSGSGSGSGSSGSGSGSSSGSSGSGSSGSGSASSGSDSSGSGNTCSISINCSTILDNKKDLKKEKEEFVPSNGWILKATTVSFSPGESVHDILTRVCKDKGIHMESTFSAAYDSAYIEGINQIYEKDCGELSGWMFSVNGWFPNYGCSKYTVSDGDDICWVYTCDLGKDVGDNSQY